jgi:hypothetical protein
MASLFNDMLSTVHPSFAGGAHVTTADVLQFSAGPIALRKSVEQFDAIRRLISFTFFLLLAGTLHGADMSSPFPFTPRLTGEAWKIAGDPDLTDLTTTNQQPVDFGTWQASDGAWQLWSCIRSTKEKGFTRLFYRWEGKTLETPSWEPKGIALHADTQFGEKQGGLQAPFVFREGNRFIMFYGGWNDICSASSADGKSFERQLDANGKATLFGSESGNTRDPMVIRIGNIWYCYYTAHFDNKGADYCRTSTNLKDWSKPYTVARGGSSGTGPYSAECPFVVEHEPGKFYLFRTQRYGKDAQTSVYFSTDPLDFGVDNDEGHFVSTLPVAAPEIIRQNDQWYIATLLPSLKGIQISRLKWEKNSARAATP